MEQIKYQQEISPERQNQYSDFLIDPSFQVVNRIFVLSFESEEDRKVHTGYYLPKVGIKDYNVMIDRKNVFDQPVKRDMRTYDNIQKIATGQGDGYTTDCLLHYNYFNNYYKMIEIDLSKQQVFNADSRAIKQINFSGNLNRAEGATMFFTIEEAKETIEIFQLWKYCECRRTT